MQYGTNGRLWVLSGGGIQQIDPTTGASTGPNATNADGQFPLLIYGGDIRVSSDRKTLYYGGYGTSPSYLYKYDVSGTTPSQVWAMSPGSNGEDVELSHNGNTIVHVDGGGNGSGYGIIPYRTSDQLAAGTMNVGAYPRSFAYSPDDKVGYAGAVFQTPNIQIYDLTTFLKTGTITAAAGPSGLFVDDSGRYLFASEPNATQVFATGRSVPEPAAVSLMGGGDRLDGTARAACGVNGHGSAFGIRLGRSRRGVMTALSPCATGVVRACQITSIRGTGRGGRWRRGVASPRRFRRLRGR